MVMIFDFSSFIAYMVSIEPMLFAFKIECYADNLILLGYFTSITRCVKQISTKKRVKDVIDN
ncbi:hypothetical protein P3T76_009199 [Phytophthora citrophthora]|uniref:Uncharacterized protein n=1 Tax=Phytophthora citrophthora TaxID=4793 RepID=A0AAD9LJW8_9STRA|nr:hypothetical protein P3T76_009199 [Phytophthora citrophthora]